MKNQKPKITAIRSEWMALAAQADHQLELSKPNIAKLTVDGYDSLLIGLLGLRHLVKQLVPRLLDGRPGEETLALRIDYLLILCFLRFERHLSTPFHGIDTVRAQFHQAYINISHV
jgi:hypothetical protein